MLALISSLLGDRCFQDIDANRERPNLETYYLSESGHFMIHYDTEGNNAPNSNDININNVPDYIESVASIAEESRNTLINLMGYLPEPNDGDNIYDIYVLNLSAWGWNAVENSITGASYIKIDNDYSGANFESDYCDDNLDKMKISIAHEFFHAIQRSYRPNPNTDHDFLLEMSSMWFEDLMVPECNDYLSFVDALSYSIFNNPTQKFDGSDLTSSQSSANFGYSMALFLHYLSSQFEEIVVRKIWEEYSLGFNAREAIIQTIQNDFNGSFSEAWTDFISSNMFCGYYNYFNQDIYYYSDQQYVDPIETDFSDYVFSENSESYSLEISPYSVSILTLGIMEDMLVDIDFSDYEEFSGYYSTVPSFRSLIDSSLSNFELNSGNKFNIILTALSSGAEIDISFESENIPDQEFEILAIYPNPLSQNDRLTVQIENNFNINSLNIRYYNVLGQWLNTVSIDSSIGPGVNILDIPISEYLKSSGLYFLVFKVNGEQDYIKKIIFLQ